MCRTSVRVRRFSLRRARLRHKPRYHVGSFRNHRDRRIAGRLDGSGHGILDRIDDVHAGQPPVLDRQAHASTGGCRRGASA